MGITGMEKWVRGVERETSMKVGMKGERNEKWV